MASPGAASTIQATSTRVPARRHAATLNAISYTGRAYGLVVQAEPDLQRDLYVGDLAVAQVAADLRHLEPVEVAQGLRGAGDGVADGLVNAVRRRADNLRDAVHVIAHRLILGPV